MELIDAQEVTINDSQKNLSEYIRLIKQANDTADIDEKLRIFDQANKAFARYEFAEKRYNALNEKITENLEV